MMIHSDTHTTIQTGLQIMSNREGWVTASEAAKILRVSRATFYRMLESGGLEGIETYTPGERMTRYKEADLVAWRESRVTKLKASK